VNVVLSLEVYLWPCER